MFVFFHIGAVSGDLVGSMDSGYSGLCVFDRLLDDPVGLFGTKWRNKAHIDPQLALIRNDIRTITALDLPKCDRRLTEIRMCRRVLDRGTDLMNDLRHGGNSVCPFLWRTGMSRVPGDCDLVPGPSFVGNLDLPVGRFGIQNPVFFCDPAGLDTAFASTHKIFFVYGTDQF